MQHMMTLVTTCDFIITAAYFSIPFQILVALWKSPPHRKIPLKLVVTLILFAFFIFLCGTGHLMRCMGKGHTTAFVYVNVATAMISLITALYLIPLIPCMFSLLDESLNKLTNETKESKSKLFTFMAFLCHEIRNPLFAITSSAEFLKDTELQPGQAEEVSSICDSSLLMLRLVNDVLDLSKLDSGKLELESREFDLQSLLRRLGENMTRQVDRKHKGAVQLLFEMTPDVPKVIIGDSCRILQIVYNLLSNSCKFTSNGNIQLMIRLADEEAERKEQDASRKAGAHSVTMSTDRPCTVLSGGNPTEESEDERNLFSMALLDGDANNTDVETGVCGKLIPQNSDESIVVLSIIVADTGIGIPTSRLNTIFEPYTQAKLSDFRQHGGTGLGLSIISSLIKIMGGTISVTSKVGEGTRFHLKFPVRVPHNPILSDSSDSDGAHVNFGGDTRGGSTDDQFLQARRLPVFEDTLEKKNGASSACSLSQCKSSKDQGNALKGSSIDGALFSLVPDGCSGEVKNEQNGLSGASRSGDLLDSAMDGSLFLSASLANASQRRTREPSPTAPARPSFDFPSRSNVVLVVDDNSVNRKILGKMLKGYNLEHEIACNGQEAVDILLQSRNATGDPSRPHFGLVYMDISMPVLDGNSAIKAIRKANISVPIVALSANVLSQERDRTICLGADEFHTKPILRNDLHMLCTRFLYKDGQKPQVVPRSVSGTNKENASSRRSSESSTETNSFSSSEVERAGHSRSEQQPPQVGDLLV